MSQTFEFFGKYILLEKLGMGGMAEIYLARSTGAGGVSKFVAIKRILPQYSEQPEFIDMFKDEAKIAVNLTHANVVPIFEFGMQDNRLYLAMDYVEGRNLRQILNKMKKSGVTFAIEQVLYIIKEVAAGLDHAHRCIDPNTGKPLNIIHRDMSPQNVMIGFEGEVRVVDFGIAKAETQIETTRAGTLKGKFGYMSPEQAEGQNVDLRTDIFALGIVLWELLANDRLFVANNEVNTLRKIRDCQIPSLRKINPNIPPELERIVSKALAKDRNLRYQTSAALHRELSRFLNRQYPDFSAQDFSVFIKTLFASEILDSRKKMVEYSKADMRPQQSATPTPSAQLAAQAQAQAQAQVMTLPLENKVEHSISRQTSVTENTAGESEFNKGEVVENTASRDRKALKPPPIPAQLTIPQPKSQVLAPPPVQSKALAQARADVSTRGLKIENSYSSQGSRVREHSLSGVVNNPSTRIANSGTYNGTRSFSHSDVSRGPNVIQIFFPVFVVILLIGFGAASFILQNKERKQAVIDLATKHLPPEITKYLPGAGKTAVASGAPEATTAAVDQLPQHVLSINTNPPGADVLVNGQPIGVSPIAHELKHDVEYKITLRFAGYEDYSQTVRLKHADQLRKTLVAVVNEKRGFLDINVIGAGTVYIDGVVVTGSTRGVPVTANKELRIKVLDAGTRATDEMKVRVGENATQRITLYPRAPRAPSNSPQKH